MKISGLVLLCILFASSFAKAQQAWVPVGTQWTFAAHYGGDFLGNDKEFGYAQLEAVKDSVIDGINCSKLVWDRSLTCGPENNAFFYEKDGKVYRYIHWRKEFRLYADFNLGVGDTIIRRDWSGADSVLLRIDSITTPAALNGRRKFHLTSLNVIIHGLFEVLYEDLGYFDALGLNPEATYIICDGAAVWNLRCFQSGTSSVKLVSGDCKEELYVSVPEVENSDEIRVFPNPAKDRVSLTVPAEVILESVQLFNLQGQLLRTVEHFSETEIQMDLSDLISGTYVLRLETNQGVENRMLRKD